MPVEEGTNLVATIPGAVGDVLIDSYPVESLETLSAWELIVLTPDAYFPEEDSGD